MKFPGSAAEISIRLKLQAFSKVLNSFHVFLEVLYILSSIDPFLLIVWAKVYIDPDTSLFFPEQYSLIIFFVVTQTDMSEL